MTQHQALLNEFQKLAKKKQSDIWISYVAGATGGVAAALVVSPLNVLNTVLEAPGREKADTIWKTIKNIKAQRGWKGFYAGLPIKLLKIAPAAAITFGTSMTIKNLLDKNK